jgi:formylglycine-generating enzyme required for sulfatase activity
MPPRVMKLRETIESAPEIEQPNSQRKRAEIGRYLLQVDRQTKGSYATAELAEAAGLAIKTGHPVVQVSIYDALECSNTLVELPAATS